MPPSVGLDLGSMLAEHAACGIAVLLLLLLLTTRERLALAFALSLQTRLSEAIRRGWGLKWQPLLG